MKDYSAYINSKRDELFSKASIGKTEEEMERIRKAYAFAEKAHSGQYRKSGIPYITHPIAVALIVADEFDLSVDSIIASLLHDVVEDTRFSNDDIASTFGDNVAFLVRILTKEKRADNDLSKQVDNFKQMLNSLNYDIRALLIKLADRLHNMRTLSSMKSDKQMKIAGETDYFYAPLANRLGLYNVKSELENLSLMFRIPVEYSELDSKIKAFKYENRDVVRSFIEPVKKALQDSGVDAKVICKTRSVCAVWRKIIQNASSFKQIESIQIIRVIINYNAKCGLSEKDLCLRAYSILSSMYKEKPGSLVNYIDSPKENGYQSLHFKLMCRNGRWMEIHISSERMEKNSIQGCMAQRDGLEYWVKSFKTVLRDISNSGTEKDYMENITYNFYNDDISVFTPKGREIVLPKGASAIDFAYAIHTKVVGEHALYAKINGQLVSLKTILRRGDRVFIGTNEDATPKEDWLDYVKTYKAKKNISSYLKHQMEIKSTSPYIYCNICKPIPGDEVIGFNNGDGSITVHKRSCTKAISRAAQAGGSIVPVVLPIDDVVYPVKIKVIGVDRDGLLFDLIKIVSKDLDINMGGLLIESKDSIAKCTFTLNVHSINELSTLIVFMMQIKGVVEVIRVFD